MVLQREPQQASIWGWSEAGDVVTVTFNNLGYRATAGKNGAWSVSLPATKAGGPYVIAVASSAGEKIVLDNVLFGDVYICTGQSNMVLTVGMAFNATYELGLASKYPNIRVFVTGETNISATPLDDLVQVQLPWSVPSEKTLSGGDWTYFSATSWYFGKGLYDQYQVPIGLISSSWRGTYIQAWSSRAALTACNITAEPALPTADPNQPSVLWNAMINPFVPMALRGAVWYQGEHNVGENVLYTCAFPALIENWRLNFAKGFSFPFFFVHLQAWTGSTGSGSVSVALLREAQLAALKVKAVGYASAIDLGDPTSPWLTIHPRDKQDVGKRLVSAARSIAYGENVVWQGPTFLSATQAVRNLVATVSVLFTTYGAPGLKTHTPVPCPAATTCENFQILLSDKVWYPPDSVALSTTPNQVTLTLNLKSALTVQGVRYGFAIWPTVTLYSAEDLPAIPFNYNF